MFPIFKALQFRYDVKCLLYYSKYLLWLATTTQVEMESTHAQYTLPFPFHGTCSTHLLEANIAYFGLALTLHTTTYDGLIPLSNYAKHHQEQTVSIWGLTKF